MQARWTNDTGHAWLLLLDRLSPAGWKERVESVAPDQVLAEVLGMAAGAADSLFSSARHSAAWAEANDSARQLASRTLARRDSAEQAFWNQPGVPIRVYFGRVTQMSTSQRALPDGRLEQVVQFGGNEVVVRGLSRSICCPGVVTVTPLAGRHAVVDGREIPLDRAGARVEGAVTLDLPGITLRFGNAALAVFADSITVQAR